MTYMCVQLCEIWDNVGMCAVGTISPNLGSICNMMLPNYNSCFNAILTALSPPPRVKQYTAVPYLHNHPQAREVVEVTVILRQIRMPISTCNTVTNCYRLVWHSSYLLTARHNVRRLVWSHYARGATTQCVHALRRPCICLCLTVPNRDPVLWEISTSSQPKITVL